MKIGIIGSYGGGSIGDEAILNGLINALNEAYDDQNINISIFTSSVENTTSSINFDKYKLNIRVINWATGKETNKTSKIKSSKNINLKRFNFKNFYAFSQTKFPSLTIFTEKYCRRLLKKTLLKPGLFNDLEILLFGGGNILMDFYPKWLLLLEEILHEANKSKVKVYFLGVGAGPINTFYGKKIIKNILGNYYISTRDIKSRFLLEEISSERLKANTDLAFGLFRGKIKNIVKHGIGVTVVPFFAEYYWPKKNRKKFNNYKYNMAKILDNLISKSKEEIFFFATNFPSDLKAAKDIMSLMNSKSMIFVEDKRLSVDQILNFCEKRKFVIGTRLHSLILSACVNTNFYAINYQPKVNYFLEKINKNDNYIDINKLTNYTLSIKEIEEITNKIYQAYLSSNSNNSQLIKAEKDKLLNEIKNIIDDYIKHS